MVLVGLVSIIAVVMIIARAVSSAIARRCGIVVQMAGEVCSQALLLEDKSQNIRDKNRSKKVKCA